MQRSTKSELQMLRELVWHWGTIFRCCFCKEELLPYGGLTYGHRRHGPIKVKLTIHHKDHNRDNNSPENREPCHQACHIKYHADLRRKNAGRPNLPNQ